MVVRHKKTKMNKNQDVFGQIIKDRFLGEIKKTEKLGGKTWFSEYSDWFDREKKAISYARGKVLDIGCAAGRHTLYLQKKGFDILAIDNSPLAIQICRKRGVKKAKVLSITKLSYKLGCFDTILMFGNNFGLMANPKRAKWLLRRFKAMTSGNGIILAGSSPISWEHVSQDIKNRVIHNERLGKFPGEERRKMIYGNKSCLIDWLSVSEDEMLDIVKGTGWTIRDFIHDETEAYVAIIEKDN